MAGWCADVCVGNSRFAVLFSFIFFEGALIYVGNKDCNYDYSSSGSLRL